MTLPLAGPVSVSGGSGCVANFSAAQLVFCSRESRKPESSKNSDFSSPPPPPPQGLIQPLTHSISFTIHLFSFPLAAAHKVRPAVRAGLRWDYRTAQAGRDGRISQPGPAPGPPPAFPRRLFLQGRRELPPPPSQKSSFRVEDPRLFPPSSVGKDGDGKVRRDPAQGAWARAEGLKNSFLGQTSRFVTSRGAEVRKRKNPVASNCSLLPLKPRPCMSPCHRLPQARGSLQPSQNHGMRP